MPVYLDFKSLSCKNCYRCLRECPVKAIEVVNNRAKIIEERCILCGKCTKVCHQNAKYVHTEISEIKALLKKHKVVASVAPSYVSSFGVNDFNVFKVALMKLGFDDAEETAVGANIVSQEYKKDLLSGKYKNYITSACPAVVKIIENYYPKALPYLSQVNSPMVVHAKAIKSVNENLKVVFIGPCIAKKREAMESGVIDGVLTFEDLSALLLENNVEFNSEVRNIIKTDNENNINLSKFYPISRGIIKSFGGYPNGYEFVSVDGVERVLEVLKDIETITDTFVEANACEFGCVNGPCSLLNECGAISASGKIRKYVGNVENKKNIEHQMPCKNVELRQLHKKQNIAGKIVPETQIREILARTGKFKPEDEMNCGACGYETCRQKAWAVANGYAEVEMCVPYMREKAESMSYEIIKNNPNGILVVDFALNIVEINQSAYKLLGIDCSENVKGSQLVKYFNPTDFVIALNNMSDVVKNKVYLEKTKSYVEMSINILHGHDVMFCIIKDITDSVQNENELLEMKKETVFTAEEVIKKQMRVAQEIASLLGETTAETKIALLKLKNALNNEKRNGDES